MVEAHLSVGRAVACGGIVVMPANSSDRTGSQEFESAGQAEL